MSTEIVKSNGKGAGEIMEAVIAKGNLADLTPAQRAAYYRHVCESVGLNPLTRPFEYITLNGKLTLYARKDATDQLRNARGVSIGKPDIQYQDDLIVVGVSATDKSGRCDFDIGAVSIGGLKGEARANAIMKAITKAKRRVTLSIAGLGWMDESEVESVPGAAPVVVDAETGEILPAPTNGHRSDVQFKNDAWHSPQEALAWAQEQGLSEDDARGLLTTAKNNNGGKLNQSTAAVIYAAFRELVEATVATDTAEEPQPQPELIPAGHKYN